MLQPIKAKGKEQNGSKKAEIRMKKRIESLSDWLIESMDQSDNESISLILFILSILFESALGLLPVWIL
jgi:hypothetical protein